MISLCRSSHLVFGNFWSALGLGCWTFWSPPVLRCCSACTFGAQSDLHNLLKRADFWRFSSGGADDPCGFQEFGSGGGAITVSAWLHFFGNGTCLIHTDLSQSALLRSRTSCWSFKSSVWTLDNKVGSLVFSLSSSLISKSVSSSRLINDIGDISYQQNDAARKIIGWQTVDGQWILAAFLNEIVRLCASWFTCE